MKAIVALLFAATALGCAPLAPTTIRPTGAQNADATRVWWIIRDESGHDALALCEPANVARYGYMCARMTP